MSIFETVKDNVSLREVTQRYGIEVNRHGKALCPFHNDRHPSLYVADDHYYCFACGEHGDVIDFVGRLFQLSPYDAARKLIADFHLDPDKPPSAAALHAKRIRTEAQRLTEDERLCFSVLTEYLHLLQDWKERYAPKTPEEPMEDRFVEACQMDCHIEHLCDVFIYGSAEQRKSAVRELADTGRIRRLQEYTGRKRREERQHERNTKHDYDLAV